MNSRSTGDLRKVYRYSENISRSRGRILMMLYTEQNRGTTIDKTLTSRIENLRLRFNRLSLMRHDEIMRVYSNVDISRDISPLPRRRRRRTRSKKSRRRRRPATASNGVSMRIRRLTPDQPESEPDTSSSSRSVSPTAQPTSSPSPPPEPVTTRSPSPPLIINHIDIKPDTATIGMVPISFEPTPKTSDKNEDNDNDDGGEDKEDTDIVYPIGVIDFKPYKTVAQYRRAIGKSTNFCENPLIVADNSTETLILGLESFAQQHGCDLSFADTNQQFNRSIYHAAHGIIDLGSIHLLATDSMLTAKFQFEIDLDYDSDITQSKDDVEQFVLKFCRAISQVLSCENNDVRVFSIDKLAKKSGRCHVNFGLTTPDQKRTEQLARDLQTYARSGFATDTILQYVQPGVYEYTWKPVLSYLKIRPGDLDPKHNFDYKKPGLPEEDTRGSCTYYLPIGWYRHALKVLHKYGNDITWIGRVNAKGEWPVAFHGTHSGAVSGIVQHGLLPSAVKTDLMIDKAIDQMGEEANQPGLYVATHCNGGSYPQYTTPFTVTTFPDKSERFSIVFQCRVEPGKYTTHTTPVKKGQAWRIVDPKAVRPYGILLKKED